jgi:hypothetical protein
LLNPQPGSLRPTAPTGSITIFIVALLFTLVLHGANAAGPARVSLFAEHAQQRAQE